MEVIKLPDGDEVVINFNPCKGTKITYELEAEAQAKVLLLSTPWKKMYYYWCVDCLGFHLTKRPEGKGHNGTISSGTKPIGYWTDLHNKSEILIKEREIKKALKTKNSNLHRANRIKKIIGKFTYLNHIFKQINSNTMANVVPNHRSLNGNKKLGRIKNQIQTRDAFFRKWNVFVDKGSGHTKAKKVNKNKGLTGG